MSRRQRRVSEPAVTLTGVAVAVVAAVAVLVPVVLVRDDDRPLITAPPVGSPTPPAGTPTPSPSPALGTAGRVLPPRPSSPAARPPSPATATPATRPASPTPTGVRASAWVSGLCLATGTADPQEGAPIVQQPCGSPLVRRFRVGPGGDGAVALTDRGSGLCLDVSGASADDGVTVMLWTCTGDGNQLFTRRPVPGSGGRSQLVATHSGKCLDVLDRATTAGAEVKQFGCHSADDELELRNQSWLLGG